MDYYWFFCWFPILVISSILIPYFNSNATINEPISERTPKNMTRSKQKKVHVEETKWYRLNCTTMTYDDKIIVHFLGMEKDFDAILKFVFSSFVLLWFWKFYIDFNKNGIGLNPGLSLTISTRLSYSQKYLYPTTFHVWSLENKKIICNLLIVFMF